MGDKTNQTWRFNHQKWWLRLVPKPNKMGYRKHYIFSIKKTCKSRIETANNGDLYSKSHCVFSLPLDCKRVSKLSQKMGYKVPKWESNLQTCMGGTNPAALTELCDIFDHLPNRFYGFIPLHIPMIPIFVGEVTTFSHGFPDFPGNSHGFPMSQQLR